MKFLQNWRVRKPSDDNESVYISEKFGVRTLHIGSDTVQSSMRLSKPNDLEVSYTRSMMGFLLFNPQPRSVLMIGLGGGSIAKFIYHRFPEARAVAVEVNQQVVDVARQYFFVPPNDERLEIVVTDGAAYVHDQPLSADVVIVDGYDAESQVEALSTPAFYRDCAKALTADGILVVNLWGGRPQLHDMRQPDGQGFRRARRLSAGRPARQYRCICLQAQPRSADVAGIARPRRAPGGTARP